MGVLVVGILFFLRRELGILQSPVPDLCCGRPTTRRPNEVGCCSPIETKGGGIRLKIIAIF